METKYYNRSNNFSAPIRKEPKPFIPKDDSHEKTINASINKITEACEEKSVTSPEETVSNAILGDLKSDDILLLGLILLFLTDSKNNLLMVLVLFYLLVGTK